MAAIRIAEEGLKISISSLSQALDVAYATAWLIDKKLNFVLQDSLATEGAVTASSLFSILFSKRSRETPARRHPCAEEEELADGEMYDQSQAVHPSQVDHVEKPDETTAQTDTSNGAAHQMMDDIHSLRDSTQLEPNERKVFDLTSSEPISFDELFFRTELAGSELSAILTILELDGLVVRLPGNRFIRFQDRAHANSKSRFSSSPIPEHIAKQIERFISFTRTTFHGISRKYAQAFLATFWCYEDRKRWQAGTLLSACLASEPITLATIQAYVTPPQTLIHTIAEAVQAAV
ncbi:MAG TPA: hypothetical protein V6D17_19165 [Candidatus Obscuribacterales bacterium]